MVSCTYALLKNGEFAGYLVADNKKIYEIALEDSEDFIKLNCIRAKSS